jgi:alkylation response protein AidB-like acyl-CoA dehydrogenase
MDLSFSDEQKLLRDSAERFVEREYTFQARRALAAGDEGFSRANWRTFVELGWLGLGLPEAAGGYGGSFVDTAVLMEVLGRGLVLEPYLTSAVLGGGLLKHGGSEAQQQALIPELVAGDLMIAFAFAERQSRFNPADVATRAEEDGGGYVLRGEKCVVFNAASADRIAVTARTGGGERDQEGITVFLLEHDAPGLETRDYRTVDGLRASEVTLAGVRTGREAVLGEPGKGIDLIERVIDEGTAAVAAEAAGIMAALNEATLEYLKTRKQFGRPIGAFQALQHRMVEMTVAAEMATSLAYRAALMIDAPDPLERRRAVSAAKVQVGRAGRFIGQQAVQTHGGMGVTDELAVGHYFKRLSMIDTLFGNADYHLERYSDA